MSIHKVFAALTQISETKGSKAKESILTAVGSEKTTRSYFVHAIDKVTNLWVTAPEEASISLWTGRNDIEDMAKRWVKFQQIFKDLAARKVTGKAAQTLLMDFIKSCSNVKPFYEGRWYIAAVNRHLNIGIGPAKYRKIWPDLVSDFSVQLAKSLYDQKTMKVIQEVKNSVAFPAVLEPKLDGMNVTIVYVNGEANAYSRQNNVMPALKPWCDAFAKAIKAANAKGFKYKDFAINGEFKSDCHPDDPKNWKSSWGKTLALCHAGITPTGYSEDDIKEYDALCITRDLHFTVYNCYPVSTYTHPDQTWEVPYGHVSMPKTRSNLFNSIVNTMKKAHKGLRVSVIEQVIVNNWEEAQAVHARFLQEGHEGSMIKSITAVCVLDRTSAFIKWKVYQVFDAIILSVTKGTGKYANSGGAFIVYMPHQDDTAKCTARTEEIRNWAYENKDCIAGFKLEVVSDGADLSVAKVRNPILKRFRYDIPPESAKDVIALCHRFNIPKPTRRISPAEYRIATKNFIDAAA